MNSKANVLKFEDDEINELDEVLLNLISKQLELDEKLRALLTTTVGE